MWCGLTIFSLRKFGVRHEGFNPLDTKILKQSYKAGQVAVAGIDGDEAIHYLLGTMYARKPYTVISRVVHIHPTVAELPFGILQNDPITIWVLNGMPAHFSNTFVDGSSNTRNCSTRKSMRRRTRVGMWCRSAYTIQVAAS